MFSKSTVKEAKEIFVSVMADQFLSDEDVVAEATRMEKIIENKIADYNNRLDELEAGLERVRDIPSVAKAIEAEIASLELPPTIPSSEKLYEAARLKLSARFESLWLEFARKTELADSKVTRKKAAGGGWESRFDKWSCKTTYNGEEVYAVNFRLLSPEQKERYGLTNSAQWVVNGELGIDPKNKEKELTYINPVVRAMLNKANNTNNSKWDEGEPMSEEEIANI